MIQGEASFAGKRIETNFCISKDNIHLQSRSFVLDFSSYDSASLAGETFLHIGALKIRVFVVTKFTYTSMGAGNEAPTNGYFLMKLYFAERESNVA